MHGAVSGGCTFPSLLTSSRDLIALQVSLPLSSAQHLSDAGPAQVNGNHAWFRLVYALPHVIEESLMAGERCTWHLSHPQVRHPGTSAAYGPPVTSRRRTTPRPICKHRLRHDASSSIDRCGRRPSFHW